MKTNLNVECKNLSHHIKLDGKGLVSMETSDITDYAVNGALFYSI